MIIEIGSGIEINKSDQPDGQAPLWFDYHAIQGFGARVEEFKKFESVELGVCEIVKTQTPTGFRLLCRCVVAICLGKQTNDWCQWWLSVEWTLFDLSILIKIRCYCRVMHLLFVFWLEGNYLLNLVYSIFVVCYQPSIFCSRWYLFRDYFSQTYNRCQQAFFWSIEISSRHLRLGRTRNIHHYFSQS